MSDIATNYNIYIFIYEKESDKKENKKFICVYLFV